MKHLTLLIAVMAGAAAAQAEELVTEQTLAAARALSSGYSSELLSDLNGDGQIQVFAFGDSITRGQGDFVGPETPVTEAAAPTREAGYPLRLENLVGVPVSNLGRSGEFVATESPARFARLVPGSSADLVIISGGSNDAVIQRSSSEIFNAVQTMINIARASGKNVLLATPPITCCGHSGQQLYLNFYYDRFIQLAGVNNLRLAQVHKAFSNTCVDSDCDLLSRPEGLHPNTLGYDVQAESIIASLLNIDLFAADGAKTLEDALGLAAGGVRTKPDSAAE